MSKLRVAVLMGGTSLERDISLISGRAVVNGLNKSKYDVKIYDPAKDLEKLTQNRKKIDVAFPVLHGPGGEDGTVQGYLELLNIPYVGSGVLASALAIDKVKAKEIYQFHSISTPKYVVVENGKIPQKIPFPCVVKPVSQGSSVGTNIVNEKNRLTEAFRLARAVEERVLVEEYIAGTEITGAVIGNEKPTALPIVEIVPPEGGFFDRQVKYDGSTREIVPARISSALTHNAQQLAIKAHRVLGCRGLSRTDMMVQKPKIYVLETNTMPGMTSESLFPKAVKAAGIGFGELLDKLIGYALDRK